MLKQIAPSKTPVLPADLPAAFEPERLEAAWVQRWQADGLYAYDESRTRDETFVVDTPPPTVSGSLHIGHVFSYTHADVLVRYQRMCGKNIFYPMGWDDNGLPTERRVQNYFHVRVDLGLSYVPDLELSPLDDREAKKVAPRLISRRNFIELCHRLTAEDEQVFKALFMRIGLSVDWSLEYATMSDRCRLLAQRSFVALYRAGHIYPSDAPNMWDVDFKTAVAQAEVEEREMGGHLHDLAFAVDGQDLPLVIATTRPELLPACVGIAVHPDDPRYRSHIGQIAVSPLFFVPVPIFASPHADPEKGTGAVMVCTFGDATDVLWWREHKLPVRQVLGRDGRLQAIDFASPAWASRRPQQAAACYDEMMGKKVDQARQRAVELLADPAHASAVSAGAALQGTPKPLRRAVKFFEKGDRPLEYISAQQWFVRLLDKKADLVRRSQEVKWHPAHMGQRCQSWTEGLAIDWCISRQRFFGVSIPLWYRLDAQGKRDVHQPILADLEGAPVDPAQDVPPGFVAAQRGQPLGFAGEDDVFDTWFTSSMTPQIGSGWPQDRVRHGRLFPADLRPQSHEIIRTWAFYTIVKAALHNDSIPWHHVAISGWVLDPDRKKMSKSRGNVVVPTALLDTYSADAARYWAASARLGADTAFDEKVLKVGRRLVVKLFNAGKYVLGQQAVGDAIVDELDRAFIAALRQLVVQATAALAGKDHAEALALTERFFWSHFTDSYLELVKVRARGEQNDPVGCSSAVATLRVALAVMVRLFAPFVPFICEEIWSWQFAARTSLPSVHTSPWPTAAELDHIPEPAIASSLELAMAALRAVNRAKTEQSLSVGRPLVHAVVAAHSATKALAEGVRADVQRAARCADWRWRADDELAEGTFVVDEIIAAEQEPKKPRPQA